MKILSLDSSSITASVSVTDNDKILAENFINNGLTHSQTLMPMVEKTISESGVDINDIDIFAVTSGAGSFTGIRIGIASVKGMADALGKECFAVSTLEAIVEPLRNKNVVACAVMDARCNQVYTASFKNGERLCDDRAILIEQLGEELKNYDCEVVLIGDGAEICYEKLKDIVPNISLCDANIRYIHASNIAFIAQRKLNNGESTVKSENLVPFYLRLPQAERELKAKKLNNK